MSQPHSKPIAPLVPEAESAAEYSQPERDLLIQMAHTSIEGALEGREAPRPTAPAHLMELRGVFTTLYLRGALRGCVGYVSASLPLLHAVAETARAAAFEDNRFPPVGPEEAPHLRVSLSVLSPLFPIRAEEIEIGRHGLVVSLGGRRGLLLPQVPGEYGWDRTTFLEQTCHKAGLPRDAWKRGGAIEAFTAEVFGEEGAEH